MSLHQSTTGSFLSQLCVVLATLVLIAGGSCHCGDKSSASLQAGPQADSQVPHWDDLQLQALAAHANAIWNQTPSDLPAFFRFKTGGVYVAARENGEKKAEAWSLASSSDTAFSEALEELREQLGEGADSITTLEVFAVTGREPIDPLGQRQRLFSNIHRGSLGLEIEYEGKRYLHSPTYALASNRRNERLVELFGKEHTVTEGVLRSLPYHLLSGPQLLVDLGQSPRARQMVRGNTLVAVEEIRKPNALLFADGLASWMWNHLHSDGRLTYLYWPSQEQEAKGRHNVIRQFMATLALEEIAKTTNDESGWLRSSRNLDYNLKTYFKREGDLGLIELRGKVKLGAVALAALAIVNHRDRIQWAEQEQALLKTVDALWQPNGAFHTFYQPEDRNDNQNFYPGEALLLWATLYSQTHDPELLVRFMKSFHYYKDWHLAREAIVEPEEGGPEDRPIPGRRNPAFIPWHTMAYAKIWRETEDKELSEFIFEMNDWLLEFQQWEDLQYPDTQGRFYDPDRPFGPPHASSTGVYLEGLFEAYQVAKASFDGKRAGLYAQTIRRGLRSAMQLQFVDDIDMFYVQDKKWVRGGLRTTVYDNQIRCDNVQHTLMATLKILQSDIVSPGLPTP